MPQGKEQGQRKYEHHGGDYGRTGDTLGQELQYLLRAVVQEGQGEEAGREDGGSDYAYQFVSVRHFCCLLRALRNDMSSPMDATPRTVHRTSLKWRSTGYEEIM